MQSLKWFRKCLKQQSIFAQVPNKVARSVLRYASNFRRPQLERLPRDQLETIKDEILKNRTLTAAKWDNIRTTLIESYKHINATNVDAVILGICNEADHLAIAKSYVHHLQSNGTQPNVASWGRLLRVYNLAYHARGGNADALSEDEQNEILQIYANLRQKHDVLDTTTCENIIHGLVATKQWTDFRELLDMIKITSAPSLATYTELAVKAFSLNETNLGWQLLDEMVEQGKQPKCEIYIAYLNKIAAAGRNFQRDFERLAEFLQKYNFKITDKVANHLEDIARNRNCPLTVNTVQLTRLGKCNHCNNFMQNISISDEQLHQLNESFLQKALIRNDVFQKSTPAEVEEFRRFVDETGPFDCVIDGLNVAYSKGGKQPTKVSANLLAAVVKYFNNKNKHVLVLGRKHMNNWPKATMNFVRKNASVFLANNLSHDDPFLLYATLKSGPDADFFSRDLMRTHAFLLGPELRNIFRRWQQQHQYSLVTQTESGKLIVKEPIRHLLCAHKVNSHWHLPCMDEYKTHAVETFEVPSKWLCIKFQ